MRRCMASGYPATASRMSARRASAANMGLRPDNEATSASSTPAAAAEQTMRTEYPVHGGDLDAARLRYPAAPEPWIDLSTGINPVPYPIPEITPAAWTRLP